MFREPRIHKWLRSLLGDCRFAQRQIRKSPAFTAVAVLTLALGIGSSTAIFSAIDATLLHPYPYKNADRLATATLLDQEYFARPRFLLTTFCTFATVALLLVAAGIFSVISYNVALRTREFGIRLALGAQPTQVLSLVLRNGARLVLRGITVGLLCSYFVTRLIASEVWGVSVTDPATFACVAFLALLIGLLACLLPARRACHVDPVVALRYQ